MSFLPFLQSFTRTLKRLFVATLLTIWVAACASAPPLPKNMKACQEMLAMEIRLRKWLDERYAKCRENEKKCVEYVK